LDQSNLAVAGSLFEIRQFPPSQRRTHCSFDLDPAFRSELDHAFGQRQPGNHPKAVAVGDADPVVPTDPPTRPRTVSLLPFLGWLPSFPTFDGVRLESICFPHPLCFLPEDRIFDRLPDKVGPLPLCRRSDPVNCFQRCFIEVDEDLRHIDYLYLYFIYVIGFRRHADKRITSVRFGVARIGHRCDRDWSA
jgi:hypothetical protein